MRGAHATEKLEIPCGALRILPILDTVEGEMVFSGGFGWPIAGYGLDLDRFIGDGLRIVFEKGRVRRLETGGDQKALNRAWAAESGDKDRLGEFVLGCNPLLKPVEGTGFRPYYGFGDGVIRLTLGENIEFGWGEPRQPASVAVLHGRLDCSGRPHAGARRRDRAPGHLGAGICALSVSRSTACARASAPRPRGRRSAVADRFAP